MESCPCIDHLGTEEASGYKTMANIHPLAGVLPAPTGPFSPPRTQLTPCYWVLGRGVLYQGAGRRVGYYKVVSWQVLGEEDIGR